MQLAAYLQENDIPAAVFAKKIGVTKSMVSHMLAGRRSASPELAKVIERETKGRVPKYVTRPDIWDAPKRRAA